MQMFESFLKSIPASRSELVEDLDLPEVALTPFEWSPRRDSLASSSSQECDVMTWSTDSSIPLSRAMTDSDIDYGRFRRYKSRSFSDPWDQMKMALDAFPPEYLEQLYSFERSAPPEEARPPSRQQRRKFDEEFRQKMKSLFQVIQVFADDDPGLELLEDAIADVDMKKIIESEKMNDKKV